MIEKKRLEELIEQGATIYEIVNGGCIFDYNLKVMPSYSRSHLDFFQDMHKVFETKEEAEWHKEFGCIERTERLELPTWEEFSQGKFCFFNSKDCRYDLSPNLIHNEIVLYENVYGGGYFIYNKWELTKESYTIACRKCVELFLGEKK